MELSISVFLNRLAEHGKILPQIRVIIANEILKFSGMRQVLAGSNLEKGGPNELLHNIDTYLENLRLIELKFRHPFMVLTKSHPGEEPEINRQILQILKKLNNKKA